MLVSFMDDVRGLSVRWRFLAHFIAAGSFVVLGFSSSVSLFCFLPMAVFIVWTTNLYNFMDGSDGLAGGMTLFGFGSYSVAAWFGSDLELASATACIAATALAFLRFNFHPARIFMGDTGSIPLGFIAAALGFLGWDRGYWSFWFPVLVFSPFIVDATLTLIKRLLNREKVWQAHRTHYYQRLVQIGWGHRKTAMWEYGLMLLVGASALWLIEQPATVQALGLMFWMLAYALVAMKIDLMWNKFSAP